MPRTRHISRMALLGAALLRALAGSQGVALAGTTITVNTTVDELNGDGDCSLREAIQAANTDATVDACPAGSDDDTITIPAGTYTLGIAGTDEDNNVAGDLDITSNLTINGAGLDRVLHAHIGVTVQTSNLTITNGNLAAGQSGAGILNQGTLTLSNSIVTSNHAEWRGGGISNVATMTLNHSTISGNTAAAGGFIGGGGIFNNGTLTLSNSTVSGNMTTLEGGGINNNAGGTLMLSNSTVSGNTAGSGGGIINFNTVTVNDSTISGNTAGSGGGIFSDGTAELTNSIIASNNSGGDCSGTITSLGHNLDADNTCGLTQSTDLPNPESTEGHRWTA